MNLSPEPYYDIQDPSFTLDMGYAGQYTPRVSVTDPLYVDPIYGQDLPASFRVASYNYDAPEPPPQPEHYDSRDFIGAGNYYYVDPSVRNYSYNPNVEEQRDQERHYSRISDLASLAVGTSANKAQATAEAFQQQLADQTQWLNYLNRQRMEEQDRRNRLAQERIDAMLRFGPPAGWQ